MCRRCDGQVQVSAGFCLLLAWFAWANGLATLLTVLVAALVHEGGHLLALRLLGAETLGLRWTIFGAELAIRRDRLSYGRELIAVLAGPGSNLLLGLVLSAVRGPWLELAGANFVLCTFNLLPARPLDGGRALELLVSQIAGPMAGERVVRWIGGMVTAALATLLGTVMYRTGGSLWLLLPLLGLLGAAVNDVRPTRMRTRL